MMTLEQIKNLESLLDELEKLSRYGEVKERVDKKKRSIVSYVKFVIAKNSFLS